MPVRKEEHSYQTWCTPKIQAGLEHIPVPRLFCWFQHFWPKYFVTFVNF
uniref:Uncharacterized protein n=1 Tax=Arundo donax TaxID=35708 RepID=A0A0A9A211_ARUDO